MIVAPRLQISACRPVLTCLMTSGALKNQHSTQKYGVGVNWSKRIRPSLGDWGQTKFLNRAKSDCNRQIYTPSSKVCREATRCRCLPRRDRQPFCLTRSLRAACHSMNVFSGRSWYEKWNQYMLVYSCVASTFITPLLVVRMLAPLMSRCTMRWQCR